MRAQNILTPNLDEVMKQVKQNQLMFQYILWEQFIHNVREDFLGFVEPVVAFISPSRTMKETLMLERRDKIYVHSMQSDLYYYKTQNVKYVYDLAILSTSSKANEVFKKYVEMNEKQKTIILKSEIKLVLFHTRIYSISNSLMEITYCSPIIEVEYDEKTLEQIEDIYGTMRKNIIETILLRRKET